MRTILGESHTFADSDYWAEWLSAARRHQARRRHLHRRACRGRRGRLLADARRRRPSRRRVFPLDVEGLPAQARRGDPVTVTVVEYRSATGDIGEGDRTPVAGATVRAGSATATTGADGRASLVLSGLGTVTVRPTRPGNAAVGRARRRRHGACGGAAAAAPDRTAPVASIAGIRDGQAFSRRGAPRELRGSVTADPSGLWAVKIRLTRRLGKTCWYFSGSKEQFLKRTCGKQYAFKVGDRTDWSYLLPARLPRGRYVLDSYAIDNVFNRGASQTVRFRVR